MTSDDFRRLALELRSTMIATRSACILILLTFAFANVPAAEPAADPARAEALAVVQRFFEALHARDAAACRATIAPEGQLHALNDRAQAVTLGYRSLGEFADRLPNLKERPLERIWNPTVLVQGRIAIVWAPYDFHRDGKFSHSGHEVFTLMRAGSDWKIVSLGFTMEPDVPSRHPDGPPRK